MQTNRKEISQILHQPGRIIFNPQTMFTWLKEPIPKYTVHSKLKLLRAYLEKERILLHINSTMLPPLHCLQTIKVGIIYNTEVPLNTFPANYLQQRCLFILAATNNTATFWMAFCFIIPAFYRMDNAFNQSESVLKSTQTTLFSAKLPRVVKMQ